MTTSQPPNSKTPETRHRESTPGEYKITILVRVLERDTVIEHGRSRYAEAPALDSDGQPVPAEQFVSRLDEALLELYRLHQSERQGVEQLEFDIIQNP